ncbi:MAG: hypothetical protein N3G21_04540 [Candidatus Hydrogenedentes bacterium]|nr:hypothetical protein [Candidatus Hydrogenedentota bacterium]
MKRVKFLVSVLILVSLIALGCQTGKKITPEEAISSQVNKFVQSLKAKDIETAMTVFSEKFEHYEWGDKAGAKEFLQQAADVGYLDGIEIDLSKMQIKVEGSTGTAYPIEVSGNFGSTTVELVFTNENGNWLVTGVDASNL